MPLRAFEIRGNFNIYAIDALDEGAKIKIWAPRVFSGSPWPMPASLHGTSWPVSGKPSFTRVCVLQWTVVRNFSRRGPLTTSMGHATMTHLYQEAAQFFWMFNFLKGRWPAATPRGQTIISVGYGPKYWRTTVIEDADTLHKGDFEGTSLTEHRMDTWNYGRRRISI